MARWLVFCTCLFFAWSCRSWHISEPLIIRRGSFNHHALFDGHLAGSKAKEEYKWNDTTMSGPLGKTADNFFMSRFRSKLAEELNITSLEGAGGAIAPGFKGLMQMISLLHASAPDQEAAVETSRRTLRSLFPDWPPGAPKGQVGLLYWFGILFAKPFPKFSARLNAWVTWWAAQWLMGPCTLEDLAPSEEGAPGGAEGGRGQRLVVERCRYLEEAGCASICVATCKLPTQKFFNEDMAVPMRMLPDYETYACVFEFGHAPTTADSEEAQAASCFSQCPSRGKDREIRCADTSFNTK